MPLSGVEKDPSMIIELIEKYKVTTLLCLPSLYQFILNNADAERLNSLRIVIVAGESCPVELVKQHHSKLENTSLHNEYGPTETTVWGTAGELKADEEMNKVSIGKPIPNVQAYILDKFKFAPIGLPGTIYLGGEGISRGYFQNSGLTAEKFIPDMFSQIAGARIYRTGDIGRYRSDGQIEFLGRADSQIKIRGYRIELEEIENVIKQFAKVKDCVVQTRKDNAENTSLAAFLVEKEPFEITELRNFLTAKVPPYMIPNIFKKIEQLPLSPMEKPIATLCRKSLSKEKI